MIVVILCMDLHELIRLVYQHLLCHKTYILSVYFPPLTTQSFFILTLTSRFRRTQRHLLSQNQYSFQNEHEEKTDDSDLINSKKPFTSIAS